MQTVGYIRDINTLKVIGTIGPRKAVGFFLGDNLHHIPALGDKINIQGRQFLGFEAGQPVFTYPEPREFRVVAVTPYGAYTEKWRDKGRDNSLLPYQDEARSFAASMFNKLGIKHDTTND